MDPFADRDRPARKNLIDWGAHGHPFLGEEYEFKFTEPPQGGQHHPPEHIRELLMHAKDMLEIDAAHRYARALYPGFFNMEDLSHAVKEPKTCAI